MAERKVRLFYEQNKNIICIMMYDKNIVRQFFSSQSIKSSQIHLSSIGGGSINKTYKLSVAGQAFFCKTNSVTKFPQLFGKERNGLLLLKDQSVIKVPEVTDCFDTDREQVLVLEWIEEGARTTEFWQKFGSQLAALHSISNPYFGLDHDNYMGSVPQSNQPMTNWVQFFTEQRLRPLIDQCSDLLLLEAKHYKRFERVFMRLPELFDEKDKPALVHGDLWSGNFMCDHTSLPVLIDPAAYFGHPAVDLGMTTLFGGFRQPFYDAYHYHRPLPPDHLSQWQICNLYPLLIHLLLFGKGYLSQIEGILNSFS